jgi:putative FmdB family regulatory protein
MPLYDYRCTNCGNVVEIRHGFNDTNTETCPKCEGELSRVFNPAPIIFNGSGFYVTDSRPKDSGKGDSAA